MTKSRGAEAEAALGGTVVVPQLHLGVIRVGGRDADTFLQGQLSNDLRGLTPDTGQLASLNSPKGRMLAVLHLLRRPDGVHLLVERCILDATLRRLRMYVLRAQVTLEDLSGRCAVLGLAGPAAAGALAAAGLPAPEAPMACAQAGETAVLRRHGHVPRWTVLHPASDVAALWSRLAAQAAPAGTNAWKLLDIRAGVPTVYVETQDHFVPQMANLDQLGGISFNKGCYTGQEVVARVHYLGEIKRRLFRLRAGADEIEPGMPVYDAEADGQNVGEVVDAAILPDGARELLAVLQRTRAASRGLRVGSTAGAHAFLTE
ncbi:MAG: folate-binding protein YgfZ [Gammaproteobacteria bacterium]|nr:folate-binding protein YgfZ [Gammaproteobacteria bacterium]